MIKAFQLYQFAQVFCNNLGGFGSRRRLNLLFGRRNDAGGHGRQHQGFVRRNLQVGLLGRRVGALLQPLQRQLLPVAVTEQGLEPEAMEVVM